MWLGATLPNGYGYAWDGERPTYVHRIIYLARVGPLPAEALVHHTCGVKACVEPSHLQAVTRAEHAAIHASVYCKRGHRLSEQPQRNGVRDGVQLYACGECRRERDRRRRAA